MADLIDRQAAIHEIHKQVWLAETAKTFLTEALNELPSAQPEIIRCKDCIESYRWIIGIRKCKRYKACVTDNDFCSRAKRRENG